MKYFSPNYWFKIWLLSAPLFNDETKGINAKSINNKKIKNWASKNISSLDIINENINYKNLTNKQYSLLNQSNQNYLDLQNNNFTYYHKHRHQKHKHKRSPDKNQIQKQHKILFLKDFKLVIDQNGSFFVDSFYDFIHVLNINDIIRYLFNNKYNPFIPESNQNENNYLSHYFDQTYGIGESKKNVYYLNSFNEYTHFVLLIEVRNKDNQIIGHLELVFRTDNLYLEGFIVPDKSTPNRFNYFHFDFKIKKTNVLNEKTKRKYSTLEEEQKEINFIKLTKLFGDINLMSDKLNNFFTRQHYYKFYTEKKPNPKFNNLENFPTIIDGRTFNSITLNEIGPDYKYLFLKEEILEITWDKIYNCFLSLANVNMQDDSKINKKDYFKEISFHLFLVIFSTAEALRFHWIFDSIRFLIEKKQDCIKTVRDCNNDNIYNILVNWRTENDYFLFIYMMLNYKFKIHWELSGIDHKLNYPDFPLTPEQEELAKSMLKIIKFPNLKKYPIYQWTDLLPLIPINDNSDGDGDSELLSITSEDVVNSDPNSLLYPDSFIQHSYLPPNPEYVNDIRLWEIYKSNDLTATLEKFKNYEAWMKKQIDEYLKIKGKEEEKEKIENTISQNNYKCCNNRLRKLPSQVAALGGACMSCDVCSDPLVLNSIPLAFDEDIHIDEGNSVPALKIQRNENWTMEIHENEWLPILDSFRYSTESIWNYFEKDTPLRILFGTMVENWFFFNNKFDTSENNYFLDYTIVKKNKKSKKGKPKDICQKDWDEAGSSGGSCIDSKSKKEKRELKENTYYKVKNNDRIYMYFKNKIYLLSIYKPWVFIFLDLKENNITLIKTLNKDNKIKNLKKGDTYIGTTKGLYLLNAIDNKINQFNDLNFSIKDIFLDLEGYDYVIDQNCQIYLLLNDLKSEKLFNIESCNLHKELKIYFNSKEDLTFSNNFVGGKNPNYNDKAFDISLSMSHINPFNYKHIEHFGVSYTKVRKGTDEDHWGNEFKNCFDKNLTNYKFLCKLMDFKEDKFSSYQSVHFKFAWLNYNGIYYIRLDGFQTAYNNAFFLPNGGYMLMNLGKGIKLYNDDCSFLDFKDEREQSKIKKYYFYSDYSEFLNECEFVWNGETTCANMVEINLGIINPINYKKLKFWNVKQKIRSNWGNTYYEFRNINDYEFIRDNSIEYFIEYKELKYTLNDICNNYLFTLENINDSAGISGVSFRQKIGINWYWKEGNYYLQFSFCQYGESFSFGSGGKLLIDLGEGIILSKDNFADATDVINNNKFESNKLKRSYNSLSPNISYQMINDERKKPFKKFIENKKNLTTNNRNKRMINYLNNWKTEKSKEKNKNNWNNDFIKFINNEQNLEINSNINVNKINITNL